jgi:hypothetical protein
MYLKKYEKKKVIAKIENFTFLLVILTIIIKNALIIYIKIKNYILPTILKREITHKFIIAICLFCC